MTCEEGMGEEGRGEFIQKNSGEVFILVSNNVYIFCTFGSEPISLIAMQ